MAGRKPDFRVMFVIVEDNSKECYCRSWLSGLFLFLFLGMDHGDHAGNDPCKTGQCGDCGNYNTLPPPSALLVFRWWATSSIESIESLSRCRAPRRSCLAFESEQALVKKPDDEIGFT
jgi:hypothetical protein